MVLYDVCSHLILPETDMLPRDGKKLMDGITDVCLLIMYYLFFVKSHMFVYSLLLFPSRPGSAFCEQPCKTVYTWFSIARVLPAGRGFPGRSPTNHTRPLLAAQSMDGFQAPSELNGFDPIAKCLAVDQNQWHHLG